MTAASASQRRKIPATSLCRVTSLIVCFFFIIVNIMIYKTGMLSVKTAAAATRPSYVCLCLSVHPLGNRPNCLHQTLCVSSVQHASKVPLNEGAKSQLVDNRNDIS